MAAIIPLLAADFFLLLFLQLWTLHRPLFRALKWLLFGGLVIQSFVISILFIWHALQPKDILLDILKFDILFYTVLADNVTRIWPFAYASHLVLRRLFYIWMAIELAFFGVGIFLLLHYKVQAIWGLPVLSLWLVFVLLLDSSLRLFMGPSTEMSKKWRRKAYTFTLALFIMASLLTALMSFGIVKDWGLVFFLGFVVIEPMILWGIRHSITQQDYDEKIREELRLQTNRTPDPSKTNGHLGASTRVASLKEEEGLDGLNNGVVGKAECPPKAHIKEGLTLRDE
ncbi:hypothetical protein J3R30DRAFT_3413926 [Lentinula aciculospora]|uniref:Uncharacterized protein n=1 Tax=Lentinula aciculospora TaxID=153920 RepID=A0A9W9DES9_9AGAR|nr:hypothetical protein J3R30DRAFT_3413926 [Lentinula aciculospora]